jgi:hypothetical protein
MSDMAKLIVSTLPDRNSVAAFVASEEGVPAAGLGLANFRVRSTVPGADGTLLTVAGVAPTALKGFYILDLAVDAAARRKGLYVFDLIVETGEDRGQVLSSAIIT